MDPHFFIYRLTRPVTLLIRADGRYRLVQIPEGSIVKTRNPQPDANGMIEGTYQGSSVMMFSIDLENRTELLPVRSAGGKEAPIHRRSA
jgi:hypothetical protein